MSATWILAKSRIGWGEIKYYTGIPACPRGIGSRTSPPPPWIPKSMDDLVLWSVGSVSSESTNCIAVVDSMDGEPMGTEDQPYTLTVVNVTSE